MKICVQRRNGILSNATANPIRGATRGGIPCIHAIRWVLTVFYVGVFMLGNVQAQEENYHLGPQDVIQLSIFAGAELQQKVDLVVTEGGIINFPFIGPLNVTGMTISDLEKTIAAVLERDFFVDPQVIVQIKEYQSLRYYISGAIRNPGMYVMRSRTSMIELIAKAGGVLQDRGNVAFILRNSTQNPATEDLEQQIQNGDPLRVNLVELLDKGDMIHNIDLVSGDVVYIPHQQKMDEAQSKVYVEGEVKKPGVYDYQPGMTALSVCLLAGGFDRYAAPKRAIIIRKTSGEDQETIRIDLDAVKRGKRPDIPLKPGDRVHIPQTWL